MSDKRKLTDRRIVIAADSASTKNLRILNRQIGKVEAKGVETAQGKSGNGGNKTDRKEATKK